MGIPFSVCNTGEPQLFSSISDLKKAKNFCPDVDSSVKKKAAYGVFPIFGEELEEGNDGHFPVIGVFQAWRDHPFSDVETKGVQDLLEICGSIIAFSQSLDEVNTLYLHEKKSALQTEALLQIAKDLSSNLDMETIVSRLICHTRILLDVDRCTLFFIDHKRDELIVSKNSSKGRQRSMLDWITGKPAAQSLPFGNGRNKIALPMGGIAGHVAKTAEPVIVHDCQNDDRFDKTMDKKTGYITKNMVCFPIVDDISNKTIGVLQAINKTSGEFSISDERLMEIFSAHAALALRNAKTYQTVQKRMKQNEALFEIANVLSRELRLDPLAAVASQKVQELLDCDFCTVLIINGEFAYTNEFMSSSSGFLQNVKKDFSKQLLLEIERNSKKSKIKPQSKAKETIMFRYSIAGLDDFIDGKDESSILNVDTHMDFVPKRTSTVVFQKVMNRMEEKPLAIIMCGHKNTRNTFSSEDIRMMKAFSNQISVAIEKSELYEQTEKALNHALLEIRNLKFLLSVAKSLNSEERICSMLGEMVSQLYPLLETDHCYLYLNDEETETFFNIFDPKRTKFDYGEGFAGVTFLTKKTLKIDSRASKDKRFNRDIDCMRHTYPLESIICVPLVTKKKVRNGDKEVEQESIIGVLVVQDEKSKGGFGEEEEALLRVFGAQTTIAIKNTQSVSKIVQQTETRDSDDSAAQYLKNQGMHIPNQAVHNFFVQKSDVDFLSSIGSGSYGEVWKGELKSGNTKQLVAIKKLYLSNLDGEQIASFSSEASLMMQFSHPNIVKFVGAIPEPSNLCILTEYCRKGSMADILLDHSFEIPVDIKLQFMIDAANGMQYLHELNPVVLHRDLKSDNLLVERDWKVKVGDFGLTRFIDEKRPMSQVGTPMWMAPEVILGESYTEKADVYSFGIIMWEILTRREPYEDLETFKIVVAVVNEGLRPEIPKNINKSRIVKLMKECWAQKPQDRPEFRDIKAELLKIQEHWSKTSKL